VTFLSFIAGILAATQIIEVWHHGSIFSKMRARLQTKEGFIPDLMLCPFCFSVWAGVLVALLLVLTTHLPSNGFTILISVIVYGLAIGRGSNLLSDFFYESNRTPKFDLSDLDEEDYESD
jgi:hypothetical protein